MFYKQASRKLFIATIIGSLMDIVLAYMLVPSFGMYGSAVAFVLAKLIIVIIVVYLSKLYDDVGFRVTKMLSIIVPSLIFMVIGLYFSYTKYMTMFSWKNLVYKFGVLSAYLIYIYFTNKKILNTINNSKLFKQILGKLMNKKI